MGLSKRNPTTARVVKVICSQLGSLESSLSEESQINEDLGADSLDEVELVMALEDEFYLEISDEDAENLTTVGKIINYIDGRLSNT